MFSLSATLHSYTGVWGRIRSSVQSPPDPSRKLPTAYTHFPPWLLYGSLKNWEVLGIGPTRGRTLITPLLLLTFREDKKDTSFKEKKKTKEKTAGPSFYNCTAVGLESGSEEGGRLSRGKPDPQEHQRVGGGSPSAATLGLDIVFV